MIVRSMSRILLVPRCFYIQSARKVSSNIATTITRGRFATDQMEHLRSSVNNEVGDWKVLKTEILNIKGSLNEKNIDGVLLKVMIRENNIDAALSFAKHLLSSSDELNLGVTNGVLSLYYQIGLKKGVTEKQKQFILDSYKKLHEKYEVLDSSTCEVLLHALCVIDEWEKAVKVLEDIYLSSKPTHSAFSTLIATLFRLGKNNEALAFIEKSIQNQRPLTHVAYEEWIEYVLRKYKTKEARVKHLEEICTHVSRNCVVIPERTAEKLRSTLNNLGWHVRSTKIHKSSGQCVYCRSSLECLQLTEKEFQLLQQNVKSKLIIGSDVLLKSSEPELKRFLEFFERTGPYDIVLDALNICYAVGKYKMDKIGPLTFVVEHFRQQNKKILLIGRKHMLKWPKMRYVLDKTSTFFTDDVSQDDPYFITATILSGSRTDFVSKDLLRGHRFQMQDENLRHLFQRWQWQHQWKVFINRNGAPVLQPPLPVTPCAQKTGSCWHLPYESEEPTTLGLIKDGTPDWHSWLCLQPSYHDNGPLNQRVRQNTMHSGMSLQIESRKGTQPIGVQGKSFKENFRNTPRAKEIGHQYEDPKDITYQNEQTDQRRQQSKESRNVKQQRKSSLKISNVISELPT